jgi:hypothetical protein
MTEATLIQTSSTDEQVKKILVENSLDFRIEKLPLFVQSGDSPISTPYWGLLNTKTGEVINTVKEGYRVSQNEEVIRMIVEGIKPFGSSLKVTKGSSINGGRKVFLQLEIEGTSLVGSDTITRYITFLDSNDGTSSLSIGIGDICARCTNQFYRFYKSGQNRFRHTATIEEAINSIPRIIEGALDESMKQIQIYNSFVSTKCSRELAHKMVNHLLGFDKTTFSSTEKGTRSENIMNSLYADINTEFSQVGENLWGLLGGITRFTTHNIASPKRTNGALESLICGSGYNMNQKALELCLEIA